MEIKNLKDQKTRRVAEEVKSYGMELLMLEIIEEEHNRSDKVETYGWAPSIQ